MGFLNHLSTFCSPLTQVYCSGYLVPQIHMRQRHVPVYAHLGAGAPRGFELRVPILSVFAFIGLIFKKSKVFKRITVDDFSL